jgi:hypothetical protein
VFICQITKQLFNIMSFRISNFGAFGPKMVELCVVEKCVFWAILVGFGWSLSRGGRWGGMSVTQPITFDYKTRHLGELLSDEHFVYICSTVSTIRKSFLLTIKGQSNCPKNPQHHNRTKHIDVRYHFIRESTKLGLIQLVYISTIEMVADILTKALPRDRHEKHMKGMGLGRGSRASWGVRFFCS